MSPKHHFDQPWLGCMLSVSKEGGDWRHHHAINEPCPLNNGKPWGVSWRAADHEGEQP